MIACPHDSSVRGTLRLSRCFRLRPMQAPPAAATERAHHVTLAPGRG